MRFLWIVVASSIGAAGALLSVGTSLATVTFDNGTGAGYVGRGDVISNAALGKPALTVSPAILYVEQVQIAQTCEKETRRQVVTVDMKRERNVAFKVSSQTKSAPGNGNVAGYILTGFAAPASVPPVACPDSFQPVGSPSVTVLGQSLTFTGNGLTGVVWTP